ncbi:MAG: TlpA family protein disulfide reductase [Methylophilus sp.]
MLHKIKTILIYLILVVTLGFGIRYFFLGTQIQDGGNQSTQSLFNATFPDQHGAMQSLKPYQGKIVVLNFWATWCEPCREEMPELSALHEELKSKNVVVLGLAIDDINAINEFSQETKVSYPLFAGEEGGMDIATQLGNNKGVLPYTVIIKPDGIIHQVFFGRITKKMLETSLKSLM